MLVLLLTLVVSLVPSVRLEYSMPKFWGLFLGGAILYGCLNTCRSETALRGAAWVLLGTANLIGLIGVTYMTERPTKLFDQAVYGLLPSFDRSVQTSSVVTWGVNSNELGGIIALFVPLAVSLTTARGRLGCAALASTIVLLGTLALTQSRASIAGVAVALIIGAVWRGRWWGRPRLVTGLLLTGGTTLALFSLGRLDLLGVEYSDLFDRSSLIPRAEVWLHSLLMILDMPLTGIGLNTFSLILREFYPVASIPTRLSVDDYYAHYLTHAHNLLLQTALDLGLCGLGAFVAIVVLAVRGGLVALRAGVQRPLVVGLLLGLLAHGVYSLVDAVTLGAKPGATLWAFLGLLLALGAVARPNRARRPGRSAARTNARPALLAVGLCLLALPLLAGPIALNGALILLHRAAAPATTGSSLVEIDLALATRLAWGPYSARVWAARAVAARARGDFAGQQAALELASQLGPWNPSVFQLPAGTNREASPDEVRP